MTADLATPLAIEPVLTVDEVMSILKAGRSKIYRMMSSGELEAIKVGNSTRVTASSVRGLIDNAPRGLHDSRVYRDLQNRRRVRGRPRKQAQEAGPQAKRRGRPRKLKSTSPAATGA
jgi:excisionase family DNA binding protein